ncbi:MAG: ribonuclease Z [Clostridiales bacterium]|nr:ribonuclease Z [Clostridiales bacterium]
MIVVVCVDDKDGMMFNHRRQSQDRLLRADLLTLVGSGRLWMNAYSRKQFTEETGTDIVIAENFLEQAADGDYCFVEDLDAALWLPRVEAVLVYRWNRHYPADSYLNHQLLEGLAIADTKEFAGSSHEKITRELYR